MRSSVNQLPTHIPVTRLCSRAWGILRQEGPRSLSRSVASFTDSQRPQLSAIYRYLKHRIRHGSSAPSPYKLIHINPNHVEYMMLDNKFNHRVSLYGTHIRGGNWDKTVFDDQLMFVGSWQQYDKLGVIPFDEYVFYQSFKAHFKEGVPWDETEVVQWFLETRQPNSAYDTEEKIYSRLEEVDRLYEFIKTQGYQTQRMLHNTDDAPLTNPNVDFYTPSVIPEYGEVMVNIDRDGNIIFDEGRHRFTIAKILGLDQIPVRVLVRHKQWQQVRKKVNLAVSIDELSKETQAHLGHPDLFDVTRNSLLTHAEETVQTVPSPTTTQTA